MYDVVVLGAGLAGGLIALALAERRPEVRLAVVDPGPPGGHHLWSHFASDVAAADAWLVEPLIGYRWPDYDVAFPAHRRTLAVPYRSITSERFAAVLTQRLPSGALVAGEVVDADPHRVTLADGRGLATRAVIDCRGPGDLGRLELGWQKFVGRSLRLRAPHGLDRPVVMDATVSQADGYRFVYLLPFGPDEVFVEDTYYSDSAVLDRPLLDDRIAAYAAGRGWQVVGTDREESGVLPVVLGGDFAAYWDSTGPELAKAGMRAGLCHPTTGYSFPDAVRLAGRIAAAPDLSGPALRSLTREHAERTWGDRGFYRMLDTMLFRAAEPERRYRVLEKFYRLPPEVVSRFYAGRSTRLDQLRILSGRPPVPVARAVRVLAHQRRERRAPAGEEVLSAG